MKRKLFIFMLVLLLSVSLALAVTISVDKMPPDYNRGEDVVIDIDSCPLQTSALQVFNPVSSQVYIAHGDGSWQNVYSTISDSADGMYRLVASCEDGSASEISFCVDDPGCTTTSSGSGNGNSCSTNITCSVFSYCNSTLQQGRTCIDGNACVRDYQETKSCAQCEESWICSAWSVCQSGKQTRTCVDDHKCNTLINKPIEQQSCTTGSSKPPVVMPPKPTPTTKQPRVSFFDQYKWWLLGALLLLIILVALFVLLYYQKKNKRKVYNFDELKNWIMKEKSAGTLDNDIKKILSEQTGWSKEEVDKAFKELSLRKSNSSMNSPSMNSYTQTKPLKPSANNLGVQKNLRRKI